MREPRLCGIHTAPDEDEESSAEIHLDYRRGKMNLPNASVEQHRVDSICTISFLHEE